MSSLSHIEFRIDGRKMEIVSSYTHLGHIISSSDGDKLDIMKQKCAFNGQVNNTLCFFGKLPSVVKSRLVASYCTSFYGCELWDLTCVQLLDLCTTWRKGVRRVWDLPYTTHRYLLPLLGRCLPVLDEICRRSMIFVITCLSHTSSLVKYVAHHSIRFGLNFSLVGRNVLYCSRGTVLMFLTFLQIILDLYRILCIRVRGLRLLKLSCMRLICCLSVYLLEMVRQHCPVGFLGQIYNQL